MKKQALTKKQKLAAYIKQHSAFYTFEDFDRYTTKQLESIKRNIEEGRKKPNG